MSPQTHVQLTGSDPHKYGPRRGAIVGPRPPLSPFPAQDYSPVRPSVPWDPVPCLWLGSPRLNSAGSPPQEGTPGPTCPLDAGPQKAGPRRAPQSGGSQGQAAGPTSMSPTGSAHVLNPSAEQKACHLDTPQLPPPWLGNRFQTTGPRHRFSAPHTAPRDRTLSRMPGAFPSKDHTRSNRHPSICSSLLMDARPEWWVEGGRRLT